MPSDLENVFDEMNALWASEIVPFPCLPESYSGEKEAIEAFRRALFIQTSQGPEAVLFPIAIAMRIYLDGKPTQMMMTMT